MKRSEIKRNPDKVREFVERGRAAGARSLQDSARQAALRNQADMPNMRAAPLDRNKTAKGPKGTRKRRVEFRARRSAREQTCAWPGCDRQAATWHHWTAQALIRAYVRSLRIHDEQERRRLTSKLLRDERNISPFCPKHHGSHGTSAHEYTWTQVPASALEFATELGAEYVARLRRLYPVTRVRRLYPEGAASSPTPEPSPRGRGR